MAWDISGNFRAGMYMRPDATATETLGYGRIYRKA
jgi:hypothetical protein